MAKATSILEKYKEAIGEAEKIKEEAKADLLEKINAALAELKELGFSYRLTEGSKDEKPKSGKGKGKVSDKVCEICGFQTDPAHDERSHRYQKGPLTEADLKKQKRKRVE